jgi:hypothetical protein
MFNEFNAKIIGLYIGDSFDKCSNLTANSLQLREDYVD